MLFLDSHVSSPSPQCNLVGQSHVAPPLMHVNKMRLLLNACVFGGWGAGVLITHGFSKRWCFSGSISSPGSGFMGLIGASSGMSAGGLCGEPVG